LALPTEARAALAGSSLESLHTDVDEDAEAAWASELNRRVAEFDNGAVNTLPWAEIATDLPCADAQFAVESVRLLVTNLAAEQLHSKETRRIGSFVSTAARRLGSDSERLPSFLPVGPKGFYDRSQPLCSLEKIGGIRNFNAVNEVVSHPPNSVDVGSCDRIKSPQLLQ
jgi:hypothetical protein